MKKKQSETFFIRLLSAALTLLVLSTANAQKPSGFDVERGRVMLKMVKEDLKKNYYDPQFRGMDVETRFKDADEKIKKSESLGQIFGTIAQVLADLNDSHTYFIPPARSTRTEYGWQVQMFGDEAYIVAVKPGSDAEKKGLRPGDRVVAADGIRLNRNNLWIFKYLYNALRPQGGIQVSIARPNGQVETIPVAAKVHQGKRVIDAVGDDYYDLVREAENESKFNRHRYIEMGDDLFIWKMPQFDMAKSEVDDFCNKFRQRKSLLLDLRGNGGGYEETLLRLIGNLFDHDVKVGDIKSRKEEKPILAKTRGKDIFTGKLVVLIDSESGSAAELFARIVQLEKRGTVIGDVSAGKVMRARSYNHQIGIDTVIFYGVTITDSDIIMTDGKSLENTGVIPDELKLPTAADLAAQLDPVLSHAASLLGINIPPEKAGAFFPIEWRK